MALKDITLGQYFPGNSFIHKLDPRTKLLFTVLYIVALFSAKRLPSYLLLMAVLAVCIQISRVRLKTILRGMKPILFIIVLTAILNLFYTPGDPIWQWKFLKITVEGIWAAIYMVLRISMLITCTFLLTYTTSPLALTDALESLLGPLKKIHIPVHELATAMECRCYHGGEGRTRMRSLHYQGMDWVTMALFMALCVVIGVLGLRLGL